FFGIELLNDVEGDPTHERPKTRGPGSSLIFTGDPGKLLLLPGTDPAPEARELRAVAHDDPTSHPTPTASARAPRSRGLAGSTILALAPQRAPDPARLRSRHRGLPQIRVRAAAQGVCRGRRAGASASSPGPGQRKIGAPLATVEPAVAPAHAGRRERSRPFGVRRTRNAAERSKTPRSARLGCRTSLAATPLFAES